MGLDRLSMRLPSRARTALLLGAALLATGATAQGPSLARGDTARPDTLRGDTLADTAVVVVGSRSLQGENYTVPRGWRVSGDVRLRDGDLTVLGEVTGDVNVQSGDAIIAGRVSGNVRVQGGDLVLRRGAVVDGDVTVVNGAVTDEGGHVRGEIRVVGGRTSSEGSEEVRVVVPGVEWIAWSIGLLQTVIGYLLAAAVAWLWLRLDPVWFNQAGAALVQHPWRSLGLGLAIAVLWLPMFLLGIVVLAVSIVGIVALPFYLLLAPLALLSLAGAGLIRVAAWLGQRLLPGSAPLRATLVGLAVFFGAFLAAQILGRGHGLLDALALLLVMAAGAALLLASAWGMGALLVAVLQARPWQRRAAATPEATP